MEPKKRIVSGMRPTGALHLGNYHGALQNWITMQDAYDCFFFIADWHALTSDYENPAYIREYSRKMMIDWLGAGLSPQKSTLFIQSHIPQHAELFLLLSMITPVPWLERNPTYKEQIDELQNKDLSTFGFLGYPVLQAADIIIYKAEGVPVGVDQAPHIELTREIARRFNHLYGRVFPEPETVLTESAKILGTDRRKMSKSYDNAIFISDPPDTVRKKVATMITDPQRIKRNDPGDPEICNVFSFHRMYSDGTLTAEIEQDCRKGAIGCVQCKQKMAESLISALEPVRETTSYYQEHPELVDEIIDRGNTKAAEEAEKTLRQVRSAIQI
ncbi:MAG TPA: tryptophan--tRNA ligase [Desulfosalsimonadaceae bacterium]|nr:tryptophan--tRNA ligase [Desulfosalsimonadaceae bacterium]